MVSPISLPAPVLANIFTFFKMFSIVNRLNQYGKQLPDTNHTIYSN